MKKVFYLPLVGLLSVITFSLCACSSDDDEEFEGDKIPELLFGKWDGYDSRGQSLTFKVYKDGTCAYKRSTYVNEDGTYVYDAAEKKITTTIEEIGEGPIVYIIELLDSDNLVVKKAAYNTRIAYKRDHSFKDD